MFLKRLFKPALALTLVAFVFAGAGFGQTRQHDVSVAVGFDNASSFARAFARHCGDTPSAYRRRSLARTI